MRGRSLKNRWWFQNWWSFLRCKNWWSRFGCSNRWSCRWWCLVFGNDRKVWDRRSIAGALHFVVFARQVAAPRFKRSRRPLRALTKRRQRDAKAPSTRSLSKSAAGYLRQLPKPLDSNGAVGRSPPDVVAGLEQTFSERHDA